ncbi:putative pentatricopeptide repeat-containing protein At5g37570 [Cornus florida]|uniref:putative pentatricopeptide repeat-containing protein At5g37570 n=1 Tax=Cornus florida TaxID=4283 RepID=UPI0028992E6E|nr:putative pentatricopeptide repeat-containing protein At5g37570 [Cornus florida]
MIVKLSFWETWKRHRWKKNFNFYSTLRHNQFYHRYTNVVSMNIAITRHAKCGQLVIARNLFDELRERTVVSWNTMISGYSKWGRFNEALSLVSAMHRTDMKLNETSFSSVLSVCARLGSLRDGKQVHGLVLKSGSEFFKLVGSALLYFYASCFEIGEARRVFGVLHESNELLWNLMLVGYVQCNLTNDALDLFYKMPTRDVVGWTTMISGYSKSENDYKKALDLFWSMREMGEVAPNEFTLDCVLRACGGLGDLQKGCVVHGLLIRYGLEFEHSIGGALIDFYCNCEAMDDAKRIYDGLVKPSLNASNSLIKGFLLMSKVDDAEGIFDALVEKNQVSYNLMIKGYAVNGRVSDSERLFLEMPQRTIASSNTMISVYSRNGEIDKALELFEETKGERNPVTWNSMISGHIQVAQHEQALRLYVTMRRLSISQTRSTFSALFHACSCLGSLQQGQLLHAHLIKTPFESNVFVGTALVDMYSKCGNFSDAQKSFINISSPNVAAWTALINGCAHHGLYSETVLLFNHMLEQGVDPNAATFVGVLSACVRAGLVTEGMRYFRLMEKCYNVTPTLEHYTSVVDLLGRSGHLQEAEDLIKEMPIEADMVVWGALLNACWLWMDMEMSERVAEKMFNLEPQPVTAYVIMSNIYARLGRWEDKMKVRKRLRGLEVKKDPGCSWIELNNRVHVFSIGDRTHPHSNVIFTTLEHLTTNVNSSIQFDCVSIERWLYSEGNILL